MLKIADRHEWDTVHEYLDDPLADGFAVEAQSIVNGLLIGTLLTDVVESLSKALAEATKK
jgi:hypothetical protein